VDDVFQLMTEVFVLNCEGRSELSREENFYWISQDKIPSKCDYLEVSALDKGGKTHSYRQYKNDVFQAASSGEIIVSKDNEIELNSLYMSRKIRGETCKAQIIRHRKKQIELREKFGPKSDLPRDYPIVPIEK